MRLILFLAALGLTAAAFGPVQAGSIEVSDAWSRATIGPPRAAAVWLTLTNSGPEDALVGAATEVADRTSLHTHLHEDGVMRMRAIESVSVGTDSSVTLKPGGDHLMLFGLTRALVVGERITVELRFASGATKTILADVLPADSQGPHSHH